MGGMRGGRIDTGIDTPQLPQTWPSGTRDARQQRRGWPTTLQAVVGDDGVLQSATCNAAIKPADGSENCLFLGTHFYVLSYRKAVFLLLLARARELRG